MANAEQLGANRHVASNEGASTRRYALSSVISARANGDGGGLSLVGGELEGSRGLLWGNRDRQAPPPLAATALQDAAPSGCRHSGPEAVRSLAPTVARLEGPLHRSLRPTGKRTRTHRSRNVNFEGVLAALS